MVEKKRRSQENGLAAALSANRWIQLLKEFNVRHQGLSCATQIICWLLKLAHDRQHETQFIAFPLTLIWLLVNCDIQDGPMLLSSRSEQDYTAACWSLSRPAVFFIGKTDGSIEVWNLLEKTSEPTQVQEHVTNSMITYIKVCSSSCEFNSNVCNLVT